MALTSTLLFVVFIQTGCFLPYVIQQGYYQAQLLAGAELIQEVLVKEKLTDLQRDRLELILKVRQFAEKQLAFSESQNYTTINLKWDRYIYNVSASKALRFEAYTWWFPIIGSVPYKGYFDKASAENEQRRLIKKGLDVMMKPIAGYSSLGYFKDPVWPQMLERPVASLVELIIHELAHATIYFKNQTDFNESFATAAGKMGTLAFLAAEYGEASTEYRHAVGFYQDEELYKNFMWQLYQQLDKIYESNLTSSEKLSQKKQIMAEAATAFRGVNFQTDAFKNATIDDTNNASLMSFKRYHSDQATFARLLERLGHDWSRFITEIRQLESAEDPLLSLGHLVDKLDKNK